MIESASELVKESAGAEILKQEQIWYYQLERL